MDAKLVWADTKPTVPGWYWYRIRDSFPSRIVELRNLKHGGNVEIYVIGHGLLDSHEGQFAGPIPHPEEPR